MSLTNTNQPTTAKVVRSESEMKSTQSVNAAFNHLASELLNGDDALKPLVWCEENHAFS